MDKVYLHADLAQYDEACALCGINLRCHGYGYIVWVTITPSKNWIREAYCNKCAPIDESTCWELYKIYNNIYIDSISPIEYIRAAHDQSSI